MSGMSTLRFSLVDSVHNLASASVDVNPLTRGVRHVLLAGTYTLCLQEKKATWNTVSNEVSVTYEASSSEEQAYAQLIAVCQRKEFQKLVQREIEQLTILAKEGRGTSTLNAQAIDWVKKTLSAKTLNMFSGLSQDECYDIERYVFTKIETNYTNQVCVKHVLAALQK
jgi:hypothetical protein